MGNVYAESVLFRQVAIRMIMWNTEWWSCHSMFVRDLDIISARLFCLPGMSRTDSLIDRNSTATESLSGKDTGMQTECLLVSVGKPLLWCCLLQLIEIFIWNQSWNVLRLTEMPIFLADSRGPTDEMESKSLLQTCPRGRLPNPDMTHWCIGLR